MSLGFQKRSELKFECCGSDTPFVEFRSACRGECYLPLYPVKPEEDDMSPPAFLREGGKEFPPRFSRRNNKN